MGAFIMYGIQPGPLLFEKRPDLVWGLVDSMYLGNVMCLILNLPLIGIFVRILYIPIGVLLPLILAICAIGVYSINGNTLEMFMALGFGIMGYVFRKIDIPLAPLVLALVLGGIMEQSFRPGDDHLGRQSHCLRQEHDLRGSVGCGRGVVACADVVR